MKKILLPVILIGVLAGCSSFKVGEIVTLTGDVEAGDSIQDYKDALAKADKTGTLENDGETMTPVFEGDKVKIIEVDDKEKMVLIELTNPADEGEQWWVSEPDLKNKSKQ